LKNTDIAHSKSEWARIQEEQNIVVSLKDWTLSTHINYFI